MISPQSGKQQNYPQLLHPQSQGESVYISIILLLATKFLVKTILFAGAVSKHTPKL